jgi:hypothetical protein
MGFNPPVPQQDSNWEIRAAVLLSLLLQVLLVFLGPVRKRSSAPSASFAVWSCYLLADWVADLTLGLLLSNIGNIGGSSSSSSTAGNDDDSGGSPMIFAFWTPFLLLHLGGPDTITAYSVEDNELWNRHLVGLLFELFSAAVIVLCSLHGNPTIPATFLILLAGVVKYGERTYSLYASSALRDSMLGPPDAGPNYAKLMSELDARTNAGMVVNFTIASSPESRPAAMTTRELHGGDDDRSRTSRPARRSRSSRSSSTSSTTWSTPRRPSPTPGPAGPSAASAPAASPPRSPPSSSSTSAATASATSTPASPTRFCSARWRSTRRRCSCFCSQTA